MNKVLTPSSAAAKSRAVTGRNYRAAVVGCGFGTHHLERLHDTGRVDVTTLVYNRNRTRADELADRFSIAKVTDDAAAVSAADVDIVVVCSPVHTHFALVSAALKAGRMVACDKPLSLTLDEARELVRLAGEIPNLVYFQWRINPGLQSLRALISSGELGQIQDIRIAFEHDFLSGSVTPWGWRHDLATAGAGSLADLGVHAFDLLAWLADDVPTVAFARGRPWFDVRMLGSGESVRCDAEDSADVLLQFRRSRTLGHIHTSRVSRGLRQLEVDVRGDVSSARLTIDPDTGRARLTANAFGDIREFDGGTGNLYSDWLDSIGSDREFSPSFKEGVLAQSLMSDAMRFIGTQT